MFQISDYRDHQSFGPVIADRVWNAWWKDAGLAVSDVTHHLTEMVDEMAVEDCAQDRTDAGGSADLK